MNSLLNNRYEIRNKVPEKFNLYNCKEFQLFKGFDSLYNQDVLLKIFTLPKNETAKRLAIAFWEREIRLTRKAMAIKGGKILLNLTDGFIDENKNQLVSVFKLQGKSLLDWINDPDGLWFLSDYNDEGRKEVWNLISCIIDGVENLHQSKIIHRNLNPNTIYYSEISDSQSIRIRGFTWSIYLTNLNSIAKQKPFRNQQYSIFTAPEVYTRRKIQKVNFNPFIIDIYSIGMLIAYIFWEGFPDNPISNYGEFEKAYEDVLNFYKNPPNYLSEQEVDLILRCIQKEPEKRIKSIIEIRNHIKNILNQFDTESNELNEKIKINWYNETDSFFLRDLVNNFSIDMNKILRDPNEWLEAEFTNSYIYTTGIREYPLVVLTDKNTIYGLKPIYLKKDNRINEDLAGIFTIRQRSTGKIYRAIQSKRPLFKLKKGFIFTSKHYERDVNSKWKRIHNYAKNELIDKLNEKNSKDLFQDRLNIMLEAEKRIDSERILKYVVINNPKIISGKKEQATIAVTKDLSRDAIGKLKGEIYDLILDFKNNDAGRIELSSSKSPSSPWDVGRVWKIKRIFKKNLTVLIERDEVKRNLDLDHHGVIRPYSMNISLSLYRRKLYTIEDFFDNNLLSSAILNPKLNTFYLGIDYEEKNKDILNILNTIPMFLVQGPPGTGKTWLASTIVAKLLDIDPYTKILISSKDHLPLDHLVESVIEKISDQIDPKPIIIRTLSSDREQTYSESDLIMKYSKYQQTIKIISNGLKKINLPPQIKREWMNELNNNSEHPSLQWTDEVQKVANVVFATSTSSSMEWMLKNSFTFDYVIIEEAAKAYPLELLPPMMLGHRWLLIGDQNQLPPYMYEKMKEYALDIVDEDEKRDDELKLDTREKIVKEMKFFEKLFEEFKSVSVIHSKDNYFPCTQLNNQWRLPPKISDLISTIFYDARFIPIKKDPEENDPFVAPKYLSKEQLIWVDSPQGNKNNGYIEERTSEGSYFNPGEIQTILNFIRKLELNHTVKKNDLDMVIITPYRAQRDEIKRELFNYRENNIDAKRLARSCFTVDSYQGRQADIVIISLVRNNLRTNIKSALGFLSSPERLNVTLSRVKKRMIIFGCSKLIKKFADHEDGEKINKILDFIKVNGFFTSSI